MVDVGDKQVTDRRAVARAVVRMAPETAAAVALRFTLGVPGVHTAIVGTTRPGRWRENASLIEAGPLHDRDHEAIRARWRAVADAGWVGQV